MPRFSTLFFVTLCVCCDIAAAEPPLASLAYVLQADRLGKNQDAAVARLVECDRDLIVIDVAFDGSESRWTPGQILTIRSGKPGRKVFAYLSIGEAENYRGYWQKTWDADQDGKPDAAAPAFLQGENPDWKGNYRVAYWDHEWQRFILSELEKILGQGFDGVYLDIVDAFETFEYDPGTKDWLDDRTNPATGNTYRRDMVAWVTRIAEQARKSRNEFQIIPQNGEALLANPDFLNQINAISVEDLFTNGKKSHSASSTKHRMQFLDRATKAGKPVWVIEYPRNDVARQAATEGARRTGFRCLLADRQLKTLGQMTSP